MKTINLDGPWKFKAINRYTALPKSYRRVTRWMEASVPGTVHTDLLANKVIRDPFYRMNELDVQWVDSQQWVYRKDFDVPPGFLEEDMVYLAAEGLDTYARITLNGRLVAATANMFVPHEFELRKYLRQGTNRIEILFDSPSERSKALERGNGRLEVSSESHRVYVRKAQYSFGWDWGPKLATSGIWKDISLRAFRRGRLENPFVKILSVNNANAVVEVSVDVQRYKDVPMSLHAFIAGDSCSVEHELRVKTSRAAFKVHIPRPQLWWPNGYGEQPMYKVVLALLSAGEEVHQLEVPFAIRTVKLLQKKDKEGKSFIFEINGTKIYCKGADWIPCDSFIPRIPDSTYESLLRMAKDAHMNMVRVWGGGIYEQDIFYGACDRLGLMVWQDFMYACGEYPARQWFVKQAKEEARKIIKRLRNHPSIVLWCGNNECEWLYCTGHPDETPDDMTGAKIFREVLPSACRQYDGTRPYWRSSPFGSGFPNAESNGNHHQWSVWSSWKDYKEYAKCNARFVTEFGFQAPPDRKTLESVTLPEDRRPQSPVMEHHNKQVEGTERLLRFLADHHRLGERFNDFLYTSQLVQAEALKFAVEHWRRRKFKTAGSLFWQLNDCWPVSSWSVVDSALRPKAAYYFAKKFFAPLLVTFRQAEKGIEVWITSDLLESAKGVANISLHSFSRKNIWSRNLKTNLSSNSSKRMYTVQPEVYSDIDHSTHYLCAQLWVDGQLVSENRFFFLEPKHLRLPKADVRSRLARHRNHNYVLSIRANTFVKNVQIVIDGADVLFDDNYFDIEPGSSKHVRFNSVLTLRELKQRIGLNHLR
jgi:beta-mannosidase